MLTHWPQLVPNMSTDIRGSDIKQHNSNQERQQMGNEEREAVVGGGGEGGRERRREGVNTKGKKTALKKSLPAD